MEGRVYFKRGVQPKCGVQNEKNVSPRLKNVESKIAFGQWILRKIIKTVATRCQVLRLKCTKIQNSAGALPQTPLGILQRFPDPLARFKGPTSKGGKWRGWERRGWEGSVVESKKILKIDADGGRD